MGEGRPREGAVSLSKQFICQDDEVTPKGTARQDAATLACHVIRLQNCSACGHHTYVDFTRATNLSMLDSVVAKDVTKRTKT